MRNTPNDCTDTEIEALALMAEDHPVGVVQPNPETILGNRPLGLLAVHVPAETPLIEIARAFASIGFVLRGARDSLIAEPCKQYETPWMSGPLAEKARQDLLDRGID